ncbi:hypothetical protein DSW25_09740 [Sulfitobacter donghicola DSW-25 = KCTC 12864 = JCM 14565]|uniref:Uncharacterized protein n=1 Tax=Sulfitobacter donghicola DSW-25 = KCTC 12864 = JCM 14565 TaxID=1300350 RepID=A0A073IIR0_9RHOB|nr:hypothetical protein DSW25_09740 [Sulfitobacter donghicola DSW-25 = KCTC 12864 = JCM 14565]
MREGINALLTNSLFHFLKLTKLHLQKKMLLRHHKIFFIQEVGDGFRSIPARGKWLEIFQFRATPMWRMCINQQEFPPKEIVKAVIQLIGVFSSKKPLQKIRQSRSNP